MRQDEKIIPEWLFREEYKHIKKEVKYLTLKH